MSYIAKYLCCLAARLAVAQGIPLMSHATAGASVSSGDGSDTETEPASHAYQPDKVTNGETKGVPAAATKHAEMKEERMEVEDEETRRKREEDEEKARELQRQADKSRPVSSTPVPGTPWCVVWTGDGRVFFYNPSTRTSVWERPEDLVTRSDVDKMVAAAPDGAGVPVSLTGTASPAAVNSGGARMKRQDSSSEDEAPSSKKSRKEDTPVKGKWHLCRLESYGTERQ